MTRIARAYQIIESLRKDGGARRGGEGRGVTATSLAVLQICGFSGNPRDASAVSLVRTAEARLDREGGGGRPVSHGYF